MSARWGQRTLVLAAALLLLTACGGEEGGPGTDAAGVVTPDGDVPHVVVTMNVLADIVDVAFGAHIEVDSVMPRGVDPHSFELSAAAAERLTQADLIVVNGLNLEENVLPIVEAAAADGTPVFEVAPQVDPIAYVDIGLDDDATMLDPHVWTDVSRMTHVPAMIADALVEAAGLDDDAAAVLEEAAAAARADLEALDAEVEELLADIPPQRRMLVTNHHVFGYFAERYDFTVIGAAIPGGTTLASPSAADLADLVAAIEEAGVPTLFADASSPTLLVDALATEADLEVEVISLWTESLSPEGEGAATFAEMMRDNTTRIAEGLGG